MVALRMEAFSGQVPAVSARLLPDTFADDAVNCNLAKGTVRPFSLPAAVANLSGGGFERAEGLYDPQAPAIPLWVGLTSEFGRVLRSPLTNDIHGRVVRLDGNSPAVPAALTLNTIDRIRDTDPWLLLGVPPPIAAPTVTPSGGSGTNTTRSYVYTLINLFGEEGQPSPVTTVSGREDDTWAVSGMAVPTGAETNNGVVSFRLYRTVTGATSVDYFAVVTQAVAQTTYNDTRTDAAIVTDGVTLQSTEWRVPENVSGIVPMPNGFFAAWAGRDIFFSEPYRPWAWPAKYILSVRDPIVGCGVYGTALVVLTNSVPTIISGPNPGVMAVERSDSIEPCLHANSIFSAAEGVFFAGAHGLMIANSSGIHNLTAGVIGVDTWRREYAPNYRFTIVQADRVFGGLQPGHGFVLDKRDARAGLTKLRNQLKVSTMWVDPISGRMFAMADGVVYSMYSEAQPIGTCGWRSKKFVFQEPVNFGAILFDTDSRRPFDPSLMFDLGDDVVVGPWTDQSTVYNYTRYNVIAYNVSPVPGTTAPGQPGDSEGWPFWSGAVDPTANLAELSGAGLPSNVDTFCLVYADGDLVWSGVIFNAVPRRLPSGRKAVLWQVDIITRVEVFSVQLAESARELASV